MAQLIRIERISDAGIQHMQNGKIETVCIDNKPNQNGYLNNEKLNEEQTEITQTKFQIWKNLIFVSFGFLFLFTSFSSLQNIQSSLNPDGGLGTISLGVVYGALVLSCMFVPSFIINKLGCKWTIVLAIFFYTPYMASNFYPHWGTFIPTAFVLGLGAAPLWSAKCTYLTQIGREYARHVGARAEVIVVRFFGIFFMIFQTGQVTGNLISSLVLQPDVNVTSVISEERLAICGAKFCNQELESSANKTKGEPSDQVKMLCGIYIAFAALGALTVIIFVSPLKRIKSDDHATTGVQLLVATFRHMANVKQILIIPLTIFSGLEQAFIAGDFTISFVTCPLGIHQVGFVMICYGVVDAICCIAFEPIVKKFSRIPIFTLGFFVNGAVGITILSWHPDPNNSIIIYVLAGFWGLADAIWQTQINAFYGVIFGQKAEAAFSNYRLWESVGFIGAFIYSTYLCIRIKLYIVLFVLLFGMIGYFIIELKLRKERKGKQKISSN